MKMKKSQPIENKEEEIVDEHVLEERRKAKIIDEFISKIPDKKSKDILIILLEKEIRKQITESVLHPKDWIKVYVEDEQRRQNCNNFNLIT